MSAPRFLSAGQATAGRGHRGALAAGRRGDNYIMALLCWGGGVRCFNYMYVCVCMCVFGGERMFPINASRWQRYHSLHILEPAH